MANYCMMEEVKTRRVGRKVTSKRRHEVGVGIQTGWTGRKGKGKQWRNEENMGVCLRGHWLDN